MDGAFAKVTTQINETITTKALSLCLTYDPWTSLGKNGYMDITSHFIDLQANLYSLCVCIKHLQESHTSELISIIIKDVLQHFKKSLESQTTDI